MNHAITTLREEKRRLAAALNVLQLQMTAGEEVGDMAREQEAELVREILQVTEAIVMLCQVKGAPSMPGDTTSYTALERWPA